MEGIRRAQVAGNVRLVGKANLHELAYGVTGINPWFGTPVNPLDPDRIPGGSSSGSAVAVGSDQADVALGSDTGGSIRIPAACCGVAGLKTTWGRIPLDGVWPLAPSFDTVGPMARDVAGLVLGMELLEPGFAPAGAVVTTVGRVRLDAHPEIDDAIDRALAGAGFDVVEIDLPGWHDATLATKHLMDAEAWAVDGPLVQAYPEEIGEVVRERLRQASLTTAADVAAARLVQAAWCAELAGAFTRVELLVLPTLADFPPRLEEADRTMRLRFTLPVNLAGVPALSIPVPVPGSHLPASLQAIGPAGREEELLAFGRVVEASS
jgi:amidase